LIVVGAALAFGLMMLWRAAPGAGAIARPTSIEIAWRSAA
jgi:hypothetical protein